MRSGDLFQRTAAIWGRALVLFAVLFALPVFAQEDRRLILDPLQAPFNLAQYAEYFIEHGTTASDWPSRMQLSDLTNLDDRAFAPVESRQIGFGWNPSIVHVRVALKNRSEQSQDWLLSFNQIDWGQGEVFLAADRQAIPSDPVFSFKQGEPRVSSDRIVQTTLTLPPNASATLYVSYQNFGSTLPMSLEVPAEYEERRLLEDIWVYVLIGLIFGVMVLTVSLIGVLHQRIALYYAGYVATATIHFCFILDLFHPSELLSRITEHVDSLYVWGAVSSVFYMLFQYAFFSSEEEINERYLMVYLGAIAVNAILLMGFAALGMPYSYYVIWAMVCLALISINGVIAIKQQVTGGVFFAIGCFALVATIFPLALSDFLTPYYTIETVTMFSLYGIAIEAITLSVAMFAKVRRIRSERAKALEAELELTRDKLEAVRRMATAAHDIQQPLASLRMALGNEAGSGAKSEDIDGAINYLDEIVRTQMAEAKSDLSRDGYPENHQAEEFELSFVFETVRTMFEQEAGAKGLSLRVVPTSLQVNSNPLAVTRILSNLVSNAIRNTQSGGVLIGGRKRAPNVRVDITDTGPGLPSHALADLQEPYSRMGDYDGQGLGLNSVRHLCEENGIEFNVSSKPAKGTTFHISLPMAAP